MPEYRVTVETLRECYEYTVEATDEINAQVIGVDLALADGLGRYTPRYTKTEAL